MIRAQSDWNIRKRDGRVVPFEAALILRAMTNAFRAELNLADEQPLDTAIQSEVERMSSQVSEELAPLASTDDGAGVEQIQDLVEMELMRSGHYRVARRYIVYRNDQSKVRAIRPPRAHPTDRRHRVHEHKKSSRQYARRIV